MDTSVKAIVQFVLIIVVFAAIASWGIDPGQAGPVKWLIRIVSPILGVAIIVLLYRDPQRKEKLPDLLREKVGNYFGCDGFCFAFIPALTNNVLWMQLYYQNRYERGCHATVVLRPPKTKIGLG